MKLRMLFSAVACVVAVAAVPPATEGCKTLTPQVASDTTQCLSCVGGDVLANYSSGTPAPLYPTLANKLVADCGGYCGADIEAVISAVAGSKDPKVQATPAYAEACRRRDAMLAPAPQDAGLTLAH